jgi:MFS family permease
MRSYLRSLAPQLPRDVYVLEAGALVNAFGSGVVLPFLLIYLHNVRGIPFGLAGLAAAAQSAAALASGFVAGTLSDRVGPKQVLFGALAVMTVAFAFMPAIHTAWQAFAVYGFWGLGSGSFWPAQSALLAGLAPAQRRAPAYALQRLVMNVGVALGGVAAGLIASVRHPGSFTTLFVINCATFVAYMLVLARVRSRSCTKSGSAVAGAPSRATVSSRCSPSSTPRSWRPRSR